MPKFSVIIPLFNKEKDIKNTIESALDQSFFDYEIIVINDGSTDESENEVLKFTDDRIVYLKTENRGVSQARNLGIKKSKGQLIAFLDADDIWYPNHLQVLYALYNEFPNAGILATNYEFIFSDSYMIKPYFIDVPKEDWKGIVVDFFKSSMKYRLAWTSAVCVPKTILNEIGDFDETITLGAGEDTDLWIRIILKKTFAFDTKITAQYNKRAGNQMTKSDTLKRSFAKLNKFIKEEETNTSLNLFLDLYRTEYAIKHKIAGDLSQFYFYKNQITTGNLTIKNRILINLPTFFLSFLYKIKKGIDKLKLF